MRGGWVTRPLSECCQIRPPKSEARKRLSNDDMVSFVPMNDLGIREKWLKPKEEKSFEAVAGSYTYFADGDVLLAKITPCFENGKLGIAKGLTNGIGFGSSEFFVLRPDKSLNAEFLFYFLSQDSFRDAGASVMSGAVGHKRVPNDFIQKIGIPVPSLLEQKRIVSILDEAFAGIATVTANTEKNLANARELFESYLHSIFSQEDDQRVSVPLEKHIRFIDYRGKTPKKTQHGLRLITAKNVRMGFLRREPEEFIKEDDYEAWMTRGIPVKGDVLFTTEAPLGLVCQLDTDEKVAFAQRIISMQPNREVIDPGYLCYALRSPLVQARIHEKATGATATGIKASLLKKIHIPLVSVEKQRDIFARLDNLESTTKELELNFKRKLESLAELKQSLLQKAFTGELTADKDISEAIRKADEIP